MILHRLVFPDSRFVLIGIRDPHSSLRRSKSETATRGGEEDEKGARYTSLFTLHSSIAPTRSLFPHASHPINPVHTLLSLLHTLLLYRYFPLYFRFHFHFHLHLDLHLHLLPPCPSSLVPLPALSRILCYVSLSTFLLALFSGQTSPSFPLDINTAPLHCRYARPFFIPSALFLPL